MNARELMDAARALVVGDKGLLAMNDSNRTRNGRFAALGIPQTEEARRTYRKLIVTTPGLGECISHLRPETFAKTMEDRGAKAEVLEVLLGAGAAEELER